MPINIHSSQLDLKLETQKPHLPLHQSHKQIQNWSKCLAGIASMVALSSHLISENMDVPEFEPNWIEPDQEISMKAQFKIHFYESANRK